VPPLSLPPPPPPRGAERRRGPAEPEPERRGEELLRRHGEELFRRDASSSFILTAARCYCSCLPLLLPAPPPLDPVSYGGRGPSSAAPPAASWRRCRGGAEDGRALGRVNSSVGEWRRGRPDLRAGELLRRGSSAPPLAVAAPPLPNVAARRTELVVLPLLRPLLPLLRIWQEISCARGIRAHRRLSKRRSYKYNAPSSSVSSTTDNGTQTHVTSLRREPGTFKKTSYRRVSGASGRCGWSGGPGRNRGRYTRDECKKRITVKLWHNFLILS
jgi:hypothetical protein